MESISKPQHQIVGVFKLAQLVSYVQKQMTCDVSLESQNLIEPFHIVTAVYQIPTDADMMEKTGITSSARRDNPTANCLRKGGR